jgi:hypothetical protein
VVGDTTASRLGWASTRYRLTRPAFFVPVLAELVLAAMFLAAGHPVGAGLLAAVAVIGPLGLVAQTPSLIGSMQRRGYRPGMRLTVEWDEDTFTVSSGDASGTHHYASVAGAREVQGAVVLRLRGARVQLLLPADVVPPEARPRLRLRGRP